MGLCKYISSVRGATIDARLPAGEFRMEATAITNILLPVALGVIMLGLGLSLTLDETEPIDALIPDPLVRELEGKLRDAGRLPSAAHWRNRDRGQR